MGIKLCLEQENNQESVLLDGGCCSGRLRERKEGKEKICGKEGRKEIEREDAKRSPAEYRDWEAIVQTISMNGTVGEKEKAGKGFKRKI